MQTIFLLLFFILILKSRVNANLIKATKWGCPAKHTGKVEAYVYVKATHQHKPAAIINGRLNNIPCNNISGLPPGNVAFGALASKEEKL